MNVNVVSEYTLVILQ